MRQVRVSCASFAKTGTREELKARALAFVDRASLDEPDLIVLPENCFNGSDDPETVPGPVTDEFAERCRRYCCYLLLPLIQRKPSGELFNSAVLLDPAGEIVGEYLKMFPTDNEMLEGIIPGSDARVFDTSFGRVGVAICFDLNFPEVVEGMARQGVELVCFPSAYQGGRQLARWALDHGIYLASAHRGGVGMIVDKTGEVLEQGDAQYQPVVSRTLNLDRAIFHLDYNHTKLAEIRWRFGRSISIQVCRPEALFALEACTEEVTVDLIAKEFELESLADYLQRSRAVRQRVLQESGRA